MLKLAWGFNPSAVSAFAVTGSGDLLAKIGAEDVVAVADTGRDLLGCPSDVEVVVEGTCFSDKLSPSGFSDNLSAFESAVQLVTTEEEFSRTGKGCDSGGCPGNCEGNSSVLCCVTSFSPTHPRPNLTPAGNDLSIFLEAIFQAIGPRFAANRARLLA